MKFSRHMTALCAALAVAAVQVPSVLAHGSMKPQHGGQVQMSGETVVELVATAKGVDVYVREEDESVPASGFAARMTITAAGQKKEVPLNPASDNRLTAAGVRIPAGAKVVVALVSKANGGRIFATFPGK